MNQIPLTDINLSYHDRESIYQQSLFDPIQTHGVYGLTKDTLPKVKDFLKSKGATRFRTVKANGKGLFILCYKTVNI